MAKLTGAVLQLPFANASEKCAFIWLGPKASYLRNLS